MLRFQTPLTAAARQIIVCCLEVASDEIIDVYEDHEAWAAAYPLSSIVSPKSCHQCHLSPWSGSGVAANRSGPGKPTPSARLPLHNLDDDGAQGV
jgi:hypothetical protein